ncbi:SCO family protein [Halorubrum sp. GN11_10-6_MGM]|uniref:SCO family protein n=1 Tax=Halorubrum sp. GN11_10-6_MGM TaxID=2518112 RepID=UPI0010F72F6D|nr:SCO family protein [Halorubrum sp. GN11_10-6_MGM]TKX75104.1 SCO family protein [Halorubrum sp. GN11_10-6_MGM]
MKRRTLLAGAGTVASGSLAGCTSRLFGESPDGVVLDPQEDQIADSEDLAYPAYGQPLPSFELPAPLADGTFDSDALDRTALVTGVFTFCPGECSILLRQWATVQRRVAAAELTDEVYFLPITFDPERDDAAALRDNAASVGADLDAGNWIYLRPATPERAEAVVEDELGIGFERTTDSDRLPGYDFTHNVVTFLVNPDGTVERAYRGERLDPDRVVSDVERVAAAFADD